MSKKLTIFLFMLLAVVALLFIVSCPEESTAPRDQDEDELTIESITVVDNGDGVTLVTLPRVDQTLKVKIKLSDGTTNPTQEITYKWFHKDEINTTLGNKATYIVTEGSVNQTLSLQVTVAGVGSATWEAASPIVVIASLEVVDFRDNSVTIPKVDYTIRAKIKLSDNTYIYPEDEDNRVSYEWFYTDDDQVILSTLGSYKVTDDDIGETLELRVTGLDTASWEADGAVLQPVLYNGNVTGPMGVQGANVEITLTDDYNLTITGPNNDPVDGVVTFNGDVAGDVINGEIEAQVNVIGIATVYSTLTKTGATDDVRFIAYQAGAELVGEIITGPPLEPVTSIVVTDEDGNTTLSVAEEETLKLKAILSPVGTTETVYWAVSGGETDNTIDFESGVFTANKAGETTVIVKTYDDSNLSAHEVTITVTE